MDKKDNGSAGMDRRTFLASTAAGAVLAGGLRSSSGQAATRAAPKKKGADDLNVALIGAGDQGRVLMESCVKIPGIRFRALCDIWKYSQRYGQRWLKSRGHVVNVYEDYRELLAQEKDLDAAIVATPDWVHAEHANACMNAGLNVYCEKEMSNDLAKAKSMVLTARKTGKLLQIGHQRRSNPRYLHAVGKLLLETKLLGRVMQGYAQWNRAVSADIGWPKKYTLSAEKLSKYQYDSMTRFRNWRWYKRYGGGPIVDLGSHQIDIFSWVFRANPKSVVASGGIDYYKQHEWFDNVMCIYEFQNDQGRARAFYQVQTTTRYGGFHEAFMGENGTLVISEVPRDGNWVEREINAPDWNQYVKQGLLNELGAKIEPVATKNVVLDARVSPPLPKWPLPIDMAKPAHMPHLENFFDAIRLGKPLNCPGRIGYETAMAVLSVNKAVETGEKIEFDEKDFVV